MLNWLYYSYLIFFCFIAFFSLYISKQKQNFKYSVYSQKFYLPKTLVISKLLRILSSENNWTQKILFYVGYKTKKILKFVRFEAITLLTSILLKLVLPNCPATLQLKLFMLISVLVSKFNFGSVLFLFSTFSFISSLNKKLPSVLLSP